MKIDKNHILDLIEDMTSNFLYYDRKDDEDCPRGEIEKLVKSGDITIDEMTIKFKEVLEKNI
jgi:hypothetical protein